MEVTGAGGKTEAQAFFGPQRLIGKSPVMSALKKSAAEIAARHSTVMILGETGSGKEMLARYIHICSPRADKPFIPVDCAALSDTLFESELFGHVKGAFTGAMRDSLGLIRAANGGTLFLDEIGELSPHLQAKLLRVLQEKVVMSVGDLKPHPVDIRVVSATHRSLETMIHTGAFRQDLFFRLNVVVMHLPPLRERVSDIVPLAEHFLRTQSHLYREPVKTLSPETAMALQDYAWPGNVRELANVMEHAHVLASGPSVMPDDLPPRLHAAAQYGVIDELSLEQVERTAIAKALKKVNYNKSAAARLLGINIQRLNRRMVKLGIRTPESK
jgi:transcriptional regulator with PAS, ATPase and Fis domain